MVSILGDLPILRFLEKHHALSKKWSQYRVTCLFHTFSKNGLISSDLPILRFLEKLHTFLKMVSISGDLLILRFFRKTLRFF
jgi:hypothetical protein